MSTPPPKTQEGVYEVPAGQGISEMANKPEYAQAQGKYSAPSQYSKISSPSMHAVSPVYEAGGRPNVPEMTGQGQPNIAQIDGRPGIPQLDGRPAVPQMPNYNNTTYYPQQQQYPNPIYEMAPGQQMPQQAPPQHDQPHMAANYNNVGSVYEMYSPDPR
jgi:hypothetical protein